MASDVPVIATLQQAEAGARDEAMTHDIVARVASLSPRERLSYAQLQTIEWRIKRSAQLEITKSD